jgi:hypothetical protein
MMAGRSIQTTPPIARHFAEKWLPGMDAAAGGVGEFDHGHAVLPAYCRLAAISASSSAGVVRFGGFGFSPLPWSLSTRPVEVPPLVKSRMTYCA